MTRKPVKIDAGAFMSRMEESRNVLVTLCIASEELLWDFSSPVSSSVSSFDSSPCSSLSSPLNASLNSSLCTLSDVWEKIFSLLAQDPQQKQVHLLPSCSHFFAFLQAIRRRADEEEKREALLARPRRVSFSRAQTLQERLESISSAKDLYHKIEREELLLPLAHGLSSYPKKRSIAPGGWRCAQLVARMGQRSVLMSKVGIDQAAQALREQLRKDRVIPQLLFDPTKETHKSVRIILSQGRELAIASSPLGGHVGTGSSSDLPFAGLCWRPKELASYALKYCSALYIDTDAALHLPLDTLLRISGQAKRVGGKVALGLGPLYIDALRREELREKRRGFRRGGVKSREGLRESVRRLITEQVDCLFGETKSLYALLGIAQGKSEELFTTLYHQVELALLYDDRGVTLLLDRSLHRLEFQNEEGDGSCCGANACDLISAIVLFCFLAKENIVTVKNLLQKLFVEKTSKGHQEVSATGWREMRRTRGA